MDIFHTAGRVREVEKNSRGVGAHIIARDESLSAPFHGNITPVCFVFASEGCGGKWTRLGRG